MGPIPRLLLSLATTTRLLVISPHPDDGILAAGGLIARTVAAGGSVRVVQMTSGDAFSEGVKRIDRTATPTASEYRAYGRRREHETLAAMAALGVPASHVTFLGFPDAGLCLLSSAYESTDFVSPYTRRDSPPREERLLRGVEYRGRDVVRELEGIVASFAPTLVVLPDPADEHPDHCSTHRFATAALRSAAHHHASIRPRVLHYVIHYGQWPAAPAIEGAAPLDPPSRFRVSADWRSLMLTDEEVAEKHHALGAYKSQMMVIGGFMHGFEARNELFIEGEPPILPACWCGGENVAPR
jgi:LmbE family N-acetylglucosaminyl deacetylase